jgi:GNAT superfamily N-acetyltransferase
VQPDAPTPAASELALEAALPVFARVSGADVIDDRDHRRIATGRPFASFNHVSGVRFTDRDADARIADVNAALAAAGSVPATWWIGPSTRPLDLRTRLEAFGMREDEPELGMVIDPAGDRPAVPTPSGVTLDEVVDDAGLQDWTSIMAAAYGWADPAKADAVLSVYRTPLAEPPWIHLIVRHRGVAAACGSLFVVDGHAFVTNIGTAPEHRRLGLGSVVTSAVIDLARDRGHPAATLTASVMGRPMYERLGFVEDARFERFILE